MRKFLYLTLVVFITATSLILISCSSDDDGESLSKNNNFYSSLTVDGKKLKGTTISGEIDPTGSVDYLTVWVNTNYVSNNWFTFSFCAQESIGCIITKGLVLTNEKAWNDGIGTFFYGSVGIDNNDFLFSHIINGSLIILDYSIKEKYIELEFRNCELKYMNGSSEKSVIINGKLKAPIKGADLVEKIG